MLWNRLKPHLKMRTHLNLFTQPKNNFLHKILYFFAFIKATIKFNRGYAFMESKLQRISLHENQFNLLLFVENKIK